MIVNLRGTSGSGKSTCLRTVRDVFSSAWTAHRVEGRKQPLYYTADEGHRKLALLGHYETPCGGCDTIQGHDKIFALARQLAEEGYDVLMEGILVSEEVARTEALSKIFDVHVLFIDIPIQECLDSILARRRAKNPDAEPVNPKNTTNRVKVIRRATARLAAAGVPTFTGDREQVLARALELLCH